VCKSHTNAEHDAVEESSFHPKASSAILKGLVNWFWVLVAGGKDSIVHDCGVVELKDGGVVLCCVEGEFSIEGGF